MSNKKMKISKTMQALRYTFKNARDTLTLNTNHHSLVRDSSLVKADDEVLIELSDEE
jgi:hypothetical protein